MSLTRRGILKLLGAGATSAAAGVSPRDAAKALGLPSSVGAHVDVETLYESQATTGEVNGLMPIRRSKPSRRHLLEKLQDKYYDKGSRLHNHRAMPLNIRNKKSWSDEFKYHCWQQDQELIRMFFKEMYDNKDLSTKFLTALGLEFEDDSYYDGPEEMSTPATGSNLRF